jgi:lipoprotein-anchoring transpeptidase ErfK/SrfK
MRIAARPNLSVIARFIRIAAVALVVAIAGVDLPAQVPGSAGRPYIRRAPAPAPPRAKPAMRQASELIQGQEPINVSARLLEQVTPDNSRVRVSLSKQRAYLLVGDEVVIDSPISSGKKSRMTPSGNFHVLEKDKDHRSNVYGNFVDASGRIVRSGVSSRIDSAPSGTHFVGAPMTWFMRLTDDGVGMHVGILPGYPASHGCIRMPSAAAEMFYSHVKVGTPVVVAD